jgi:hypothetical protein
LLIAIVIIIPTALDLCGAAGLPEEEDGKFVIPLCFPYAEFTLGN